MVPVALPAHHVRQGRGGGGHEPARLLVHQRPHHEQRAPDHVRAPGHGVAADRDDVHRLVLPDGRRGVQPGPVLPQLHGPGELLVDVDRRRGRAVGREVREDEVPCLAGGDGEGPAVAALVVVVRGLGEGLTAQDEGVRAGHGHEHGGRGVAAAGVLLPLEAADPGDHGAVAEAHPQLVVHLDLAGEALDAADHVRAGGQREEVGHAHGPRVGDPHGLQHERVLHVEPLGDLGAAVLLVEDLAVGPLRDRAGGGEQPPPVVGLPQQGAEDRGGVEPGRAQPVDGPGAGDERTRAHVREQGVVLDQ